MRKPYEHKAPLIRKLLRANAGGMTARLLSLALKTDERHIRRVLDTMPDAYIGGWTEGRYIAARWCVVPVPAHAPRPLSKK